MKTRFVLAFSVVLFAVASTSQAGWGHGCGWGGGGWGGPRFYGGGWGGWGGSAIGIGFAAPVYYQPPVYYSQAVYYPRPAYVVRSGGQATLVQAQAQLARLGYYRGQIDGSFGPLTSRAISLFQADNGLRVTGRLDSTTLRSLGS